MTISNRQINTGHSKSDGMVRLIAKKEITIGGKELKVGDEIVCTRSESKRILSICKADFTLKLD